MIPTFDVVGTLPGKKTVPVVGTIDLDLRFDLWKDYIDWLDPELRSTQWHNVSILKHARVSIEASVANTVVISEVLEDFKSVSLHGEFDDTIPGAHELVIKIINLNRLPIRDDGDFFVSSMIQIECLKLQGIEISHLLENTMFGNDIEIRLPLEIPVYPWMVKNRKKILPGLFNYPMIDI